MNAVQEIEQLIKKTKYFEARNTALQSIENDPNHLRLKQLYALSLAKLGATDKALIYLESIYCKGNQDSETAGLLGRVYKDLWKKTGKLQHARTSRDIYWEDFKRHKEFYTGINAATMSLLIGETDQAKILASSVIEILDGLPKDYWSLATLGEAYLLLEDKEKAIQAYFQATKLEGVYFGDINSSYHQVMQISHSNQVQVPTEILEFLKPPTIIAFSGHMIDHPNREIPRFPATIEPLVKEKIKQAIEELDPKIVYTSAACGSDILLIECLLEKNVEINVFLPFCKEDFLKTSVSFAGHQWVFNGMDPITNKENAYGSHINRAARMEPVTLPGRIYASEQFAATLLVETGTTYKYEYIGIIQLPKNFGKQEMYSITKA